MKTNGEPSAAGRLILSAIERNGLKRTSVAKDIGISNRFMWEIIWGRRRIPMARMDRLAKVLQMTKRQTNELIVADSRLRFRYNKNNQEQYQEQSKEARS